MISLFALRPARDGDQGFLVHSWLRSYQERGRNRYIPRDLYYSDRGHRGIVLRCLEASPSWVVEFASPALEEPELLGFVCGGGHWLHYVFVKRAWRGRGLSWQLFEAAGVSRDDLQVSHATAFIEAIRRRWAKTVIHNPYEAGA